MIIEPIMTKEYHVYDVDQNSLDRNLHSHRYNVTLRSGETVFSIITHYEIEDARLCLYWGDTLMTVFMDWIMIQSERVINYA